MFGTVTVLLVMALIGAVIALLTGIATNFRELGMLYGIGGWPGRIAAFHGLVWLTALLYVGPPESDWVGAALVGIVFLGTLCAPFYVNNRRLLETIHAWDSPASGTDLATAAGSYLPVSGTVRLDLGGTRDDGAVDGGEENVMGENGGTGGSSRKISEALPGAIEPVTSPFTATECAAYEWAVKKRQRLSRRTAYSTVDHGYDAGDFVLETADGAIGVRVDTPKLLLVFDGSLAGYATTTDTPTQQGESPDPSSESVFSSLRSNEMKYCESTVGEGDSVTVVGRVEQVTRNGTSYPTVVDTEDEQTYLIDADYDTIKRTFETYLRWTPHVAALTILVGWAYIGLTVVL